MLFDLLHEEGAEALGSYESDFYAGMPALTKNNFGKGKAYYLATRPEPGFYPAFLRMLCDAQGIIPLMDTPAGVEATLRQKEDGGKKYLFLLNHAKQKRTVTLPWSGADLISGRVFAAGEQIPMQATDVLILES